MNILALNAGSSTIKYQLITLPTGNVLAKGNVEHSGVDGTDEAAGKLIESCNGVDAVGHRIVHGGSTFRSPVLIDAGVVDKLRGLRGLDPLHNPVEIALVESTMKRLPNVPHVAVFDTSFHSTIPDVAALYALPKDLSDRYELRRYGFHGLSHAYVSRTLLDCMGRGPGGSRLITCHLGNGASICAVKDGKSVDTSMGLTPLEGLIMGTRSGDVDPGLILYLMREKGMTVEEIDHLLNDKSGLLGVSGVSADVRRLTETRSTDPRAALALDMFAYRVRKYIGAYAAAMGGLDAIAFTGGIGEHAPALRAKICEELGFLGVVIDPLANGPASGESNARISAYNATVEVWVIPTNEELEIAESVAAIVAEGQPA